jgi:hypothetical protein
VFQVGFFGNRILIWAFLIAYCSMLIGLEVPVIANWLELTDPGPRGWAVVGVCVVIHIVLVEFAKFILRIIFKNELSRPGMKTNDLNMMNLPPKNELAKH